MVDLVVLQSLSYVAGAVGVLLAALNYVISTRNADKARQATLFMGIYKDLTQIGPFTLSTELMQTRWTDIADFKSKYDSSVNVDNYVKRTCIWNWLDGIGVLAKERLIDERLIYQTMGDYVSYQWIKWRDIIRHYREIGAEAPDYLDGFEFLAGNMEKIRKERGISWKPAL
jgi:hypothetical protein